MVVSIVRTGAAVVLDVGGSSDGGADDSGSGDGTRYMGRSGDRAREVGRSDDGASQGRGSVVRADEAVGSGVGSGQGDSVVSVDRAVTVGTDTVAVGTHAVSVGANAVSVAAVAREDGAALIARLRAHGRDDGETCDLEGERGLS